MFTNSIQTVIRTIMNGPDETDAIIKTQLRKVITIALRMSNRIARKCRLKNAIRICIRFGVKHIDKKQLMHSRKVQTSKRCHNFDDLLMHIYLKHYLVQELFQSS